jgi:hypothetical protein
MTNKCIDEYFAYKATNLTPAEVTELARAKEEGRLVVLPCKVGDKVKVDCEKWGNSWNFKTFEYGKFLHGEIIAIIQTKKQTLMKIQIEHNVSWKRERKRYPASALGITVFIMQEAAEAEKERLEHGKT